MKILVVSATEAECDALRNRTNKPRLKKHKIDHLITGVGMIATAYALSKKLSRGRYDLVINTGIAGSFRKEIKIGDVVNVISDCFADLGAEDGVKFLSVFEMGLHKKSDFPFRDGKLIPSLKKQNGLDELKKVNAVTVNTVHGSKKSIERVRIKFNPDIESMEGAAFYYVCMMEKIRCIQIRSISNFVERRNKKAWNIPLALKNLSDAVVKILEIIE